MNFDRPPQEAKRNNKAAAVFGAAMAAGSGAAYAEAPDTASGADQSNTTYEQPSAQTERTGVHAAAQAAIEGGVVSIDTQTQLDAVNAQIDAVIAERNAASKVGDIEKFKVAQEALSNLSDQREALVDRAADEEQQREATEKAQEVQNEYAAMGMEPPANAEQSQFTESINERVDRLTRTAEEASDAVAGAGLTEPLGDAGEKLATAWSERGEHTSKETAFEHIVAEEVPFGRALRLTGEAAGMDEESMTKLISEATNNGHNSIMAPKGSKVSIWEESDGRLRYSLSR